MNITTPQRKIIAIDPAEQSRGLSTFVDAFRNDPTVRWMFPHDYSYEASFTKFAAAFAGPAFAKHTAFQTANHQGASAWFAPGIHSEDDAIISAVDNHVPPDRQDEVLQVLEQMDSFHPEHPHWYLALIGVHPDSQGNGIGSHLLQHVLSKCDRTGHDAYLEASSLKSLPLYQRHGFKILGEIQAGTSPTLYPMLRKAQ